MKIAINIQRESLGGITASNINLINYLYGSDINFVGIEINSRVYTKSALLFRNYSPEIFDHHIINAHHLPLKKGIEKCKNLKELKSYFQETIDLVQNILQETKPDIVLVSGTYFVPWIISIAAKKEKIPIVLWYAGILAKETENYKTSIRKLFLAMERSILKKAEKIIFPSSLCKETVEKIVAKNKLKNAFVVPNPVAPKFSEPCAIDHSASKKIAAIGRYSKIKNFGKFFDLHKNLIKQGWDHMATFVTSPGPDSQTPPNSINVVPPMDQENLKKFYTSQGLIVCPSSFETFGNVPMEAASLGIPVLVNENMGCAEVLKKAKLGHMVISFDDLDKVTERVKKLCGKSISPHSLFKLKKILDERRIGERIANIIKSIDPKIKHNKKKFNT